MRISVGRHKAARMAVAAVLMGAIVVGVPAGASVPPYDSAQTGSGECHDIITQNIGVDNTDATSSADVAGTLVVDSAAYAYAAPVGVTPVLCNPITKLFGIGSAAANSVALVTKEIAVSGAGTYSVAALLTAVAVSTSPPAPSPVIGVRDSASNVVGTVEAQFHACGLGTYCPPTGSGVSFNKVLSANGSTSASSATLATQIVASGAGKIRITVSLAGFASSLGSVAQAHGEVTVDSIDVTP